MAQTLRSAASGPPSELRLTVNGDEKVFSMVADLADLVRALQFDARKVAIELNLAIVPRSLHGETKLRDGDRIEIVHFIGGG